MQPRKASYSPSPPLKTRQVKLGLKDQLVHSTELGVRLEGMLVHWPALKQTKKLSKGGAFYAQCRGHLVVHWLAAFLSDGKARPQGGGGAHMTTPCEG